MASKRKITDTNLYALLGIPSIATEQEIKKAYRKKALQCHPDKCPDNPNAANLFLELSDALAILTDTKAREAYDKTLKAKELAKERSQLLDTKRRKLKEDLERREKEAKESATTTKTSSYSDEQNLLNQIERLRREGSQVLKEQQEYIRSQLKQTLFSSPSSSSSSSKTSSNYGSSFKSSNVSSSASSGNPKAASSSFEDFEAMVLGKLKEAAQKQKDSASTSLPTSTNSTIESKSE